MALCCLLFTLFAARAFDVLNEEFERERSAYSFLVSTKELSKKINEGNLAVDAFMSKKTPRYLEYVENSRISYESLLDRAGKSAPEYKSRLNVVRKDYKQWLSLTDKDISLLATKGYKPNTLARSRLITKTLSSINSMETIQRNVISKSYSSIYTKKNVAYVLLLVGAFVSLSFCVYLSGKLIEKEELATATAIRVKLMSDVSESLIWDWNLKDNTVFFAPKWKSYLGYEEAEIADVFNSWEGVIHPDDKKEALSKIMEFSQGKTQVYGQDLRLKKRDGSYVWVYASANAVRDEEGKAHRIVGSHIPLVGSSLVEKIILTNTPAESEKAKPKPKRKPSTTPAPAPTTAKPKATKKPTPRK